MNNINLSQSYIQPMTNVNYSKLSNMQLLSREIQNETNNYSEEYLQNVAEEFSSMFMNMVFKQMRSTLNPESSPLYGGMREDIFTDLLYEEYSKTSAKEGNIGYELTKNIFDFMKDNITKQNISFYA